MNGLTVNLHLMLETFYRPTAERLRHPARFAAVPVRPVRRQVAAGPSRLRPVAGPAHRPAAPGEDCPHVEDVEEWLESHGQEIAVVVWNPVNFLTGQFFDVPRLVACGQASGLRRRPRPGPRGRQRAAGAARLGRRFRGVVSLTSTSAAVRVRSPAVSFTRLTAKTPACRAWPAGGATTRRCASACSWSRSSRPDPAPTAGRSATRRCSPPRPLRASLALYEEAGMPALAPPLAEVDRLPGVSARPIAEGAVRDHHAARPGAARLSTFAARASGIAGVAEGAGGRRE